MKQQQIDNLIQCLNSPDRDSVIFGIQTIRALNPEWKILRHIIYPKSISNLLRHNLWRDMWDIMYSQQ